MVTWYVLCDPTLKGNLLVQWRMQWKQWGANFRFGNEDAFMREKYGFGQWGYVKTDRDFPKEAAGVSVMGWSYKGIWGTPSLLEDIKNTKDINWVKSYAVRNWYLGIMIRWRQVMCIYFYEKRSTQSKLIKWETKEKWRPYISE